MGNKKSLWRAFPQEYETWCGMRQRCLNANNASYHAYGGRGISICDRWSSFEAFLEDVGQRPTIRHTLDRINNDGNYEPGNCRWATYQEQINNRRVTPKIVFRGQEMSLGDACRIAGNDYNRVHHRISSGWEVIRAIETPALEQYNKRRMERKS